MRNFFSGKKTFIVSILLILVSVGAVASNLIDLINGSGGMTWALFASDPQLQVLLQGLGLGALRLGIKKA
jgi:hypothetical protein